MSPFRRQDSRERTSEDRAVARRQRAARRAEREGAPLPPDEERDGGAAHPEEEREPVAPAAVAAEDQEREEAEPVAPAAVAAEDPEEEEAAVAAEDTAREEPEAVAPAAEDLEREEAEAVAPAAVAADDLEWEEPGREPVRPELDPSRPVRRIEPDPPAPPPAPGGTLLDDRETPLGTRKVRGGVPRRTGAPVMTPPGDVPQGPRSARRRRLRPAVLVPVVLGLALVWLCTLIWQPFAGDGDGRVVVRIPEGASAREIGDVLADANVIDSSLLFSLRATVSGDRGELRSGRHVLRRDMSYGAALDALSAPPPPPPAAPRLTKLTIPEGRSRTETAPLVRDSVRGSYLRASSRPRGGFRPRRYGAPRNLRSLEGFLFPATYELRPGATARTLVIQQLEAFEDNFRRVNLRTARRRNLTPYDVLIIASMVEREAQLPRERRLIAAVIHNRLRQGIPLGIDATIRYATRNWSRPLRQSELAIDSPFNTRTNQGLPPGPIGSPGLASMRAAARPANVDYLYYVVKPGGDGAHAFSSTDAEFQEDVARYNRAREEAGGRSPD